MEAPTQTNESSSSKQAPTHHIIFVIGAPGAGKGTLCTLLAKHFTNILHISVGDYLRILVELNCQESSYGGLNIEKISRLLQSRTLLPPTTIIPVINGAVTVISEAAAINSETTVVLIDGFPRCLESARLARATWGDPAMVLFFDCPRALAEARFVERKRSEDDDVQVFHRRYSEFELLNAQIIAFYGDKAVHIGTETETEVTWETLKARVGGLLSELGSVERKAGDPRGF